MLIVETLLIILDGVVSAVGDDVDDGLLEDSGLFVGGQGLLDSDGGTLGGKLGTG